MKWRPLSGASATLDRLRNQAPHELLGVSEAADEPTVRHAYRERVRLYHPDTVDPFLRAHGEEMVKLLNRAYRAMRLKAAR